MGRIPQDLRENIARNIRELRIRKFPGRGGGKKCAEAFGVSPQQWSPWERGQRTPDEMRLKNLAEFFGVTVEYLRRDNRSEFNGTPPSIEPEEATVALETPPGWELVPGAPSVPVNDVIWNCHKVFSGYTDDGDQVFLECKMRLVRKP